MSKYWVALAVLVLLVAPAFGDISKGTKYSVPSGWSAADKDGVRILSTNDKDGGEIIVLLLGAEAASGTSDEQLAALEKQVTADVKVNWGTKVFVTERGDLGTYYMKNMEVSSAEMGTHGRMIALLVRGDQRAVLLFIFSNQATWEKHAAGVQTLLKSVSIDAKAVTAKPTAPVATPALTVSKGGRHPTGETPDHYPGSPGWLPSGRGTTIPAPRVTKSGPVGMWWRYQVTSNNSMGPLPMVFLADGTIAHHPRPGSGTQVDLEQQRKQRGSTGVGTFNVKDGKMTTLIDGYTQTETFTSGKDKGEEWFELGKGRHYPLALATAKSIVGTWKGAGQKYVFRADGTFESGHITNNSEMTVTQSGRGTYQLDGYLLGFTLADGMQYISVVGSTGGFLVIGSVVYTRQ